MSKRITIHDIARLAGVSSSTVSRVLNGSALVAEEKRSAVLAAISTHNYRPSTTAQGLKRGRTAAVGVLTQSIASPYYGDILRGIELGLEHSELHPIIASGNWHTESELAALDLLLARQVDALIVLGGLSPAARLHSIAESLALVIVGRTVAGLEQHCLRVDDRAGAHMATRHLLQLGHRRIAHIGGPTSHEDAQDRLTGYRQALYEAGIAPDPALFVEGDYTEGSGLGAVQTLMARGASFSAIFTANDQMAYGARLALYRIGARVPEDISLVGFDDLVGSAFTTPPLTTIRQPIVEIGRLAATTVLRLLDGEQSAPQILPTELIVRESVALRRTDGSIKEPA